MSIVIVDEVALVSTELLEALAEAKVYLDDHDRTQCSDDFRGVCIESLKEPFIEQVPYKPWGKKHRRRFR